MSSCFLTIRQSSQRVLVFYKKVKIYLSLITNLSLINQFYNQSDLSDHWFSVITRFLYTKISKILYYRKSELLYIKACVRYFLSIYFFTKWEPSKNCDKCFLFHLKSFFRSRDIQIFVIFPLSTFSRYKRINKRGVIYVMNWFA